jgi:hypothetical protein
MEQRRRIERTDSMKTEERQEIKDIEERQRGTKKRRQRDRQRTLHTEKRQRDRDRETS